MISKDLGLFCNACIKNLKNTKNERKVTLCSKCRGHVKKGDAFSRIETTVVVNGQTLKECEIVLVSKKVEQKSQPNTGRCKEARDSGMVKDCSCQACRERKLLTQEQALEVQLLQRSWVQLRHSIRQAYNDNLLAGFVTSKGKKFDENHIKRLVSKLCQNDAHQLYVRLECHAKEYVMNLKVQLLQILITPHQLGLDSIASSSDHADSNCRSLTSAITVQLANYFVRSLLSFSTKFFETVDNMQILLEELETKHLSKFKLTWRTVNYALFNSVIFQDPLVRTTLPAIYKILGLPLIFPLIYSLDVMSMDELACRFEQALVLETDQQRIELMKQLYDFETSVALHKNNMDIACKAMDVFLQRQMTLYKERLKTKQKTLKNDLEIFKKKRQLLEEYVAIRKTHKECRSSPCNHEELCTLADALQRLWLPEGERAMNLIKCCDKTSNSSEEEPTFCCQPSNLYATMMVCHRCETRHCTCDPCTVMHLMSCARHVVKCDDKKRHANNKKTNDLHVVINKAESRDQSISSNSTDDTSSSSLLESDEHFLEINYHTHNFVSRTTNDAFQDHSTITMTLSDNGSQRDSLNKEIYHAYGDWEINEDPTFKLMNLPLISIQDEHNKNENVDDKNGDHKRRTTATTLDVNFDEKSINCYHQSTTNNKRSDFIQILKDSRASSIKLNDSSMNILDADKLESKQVIFNQSIVQNHINFQSDVQNYTDTFDTIDVDVDDDDVNVDDIENDNDEEEYELEEERKTSKDSSSEQSSNTPPPPLPIPSLFNEKRCDCCYCELFGHNNGKCGRNEMPQIRERLRMKLKNKAKTDRLRRDQDNNKKFGSENVRSKHNFEIKKCDMNHEFCCAENVDRHDKNAQNQNHHDRLNQEDTVVNSTCLSQMSTVDEKRDLNREFDTLDSLVEFIEGTPSTPKRNKKKRQKKKAKESSTDVACSSKEDIINIDEIFKPNDSNDLTEADKEIENFKRFVQDSKPAQQRLKINLDLKHLATSRCKNNTLRAIY